MGSVIMSSVREYTEPHAKVTGDWDGTTRASALRDLLRIVEVKKAPRVNILKRLSTFLGLALAITVSASRPPLTPAEAARVVQGPAMRANVTNAPPPVSTPPSVIVYSAPGALSWLTFPTTSARIRLDGTPLSQPITIYGRTAHRR